MTLLLAVAVAIAIALGALTAALAWAAVGWLGAWRLNRAPLLAGAGTAFTFTPWELDVDHETVTLVTADGVPLHGWFLPRPDRRRSIVVLHGYRGDKSQVLGISSALWRQGFNVLLFDFRGRGSSGPAPISMGLWEVADLTAALDWMADRVPGAGIGLIGYSMGGVVALLGGRDPRVEAIVTDSAFATQRGVLEHMAERDSRTYLRGWVAGRRFLPAVEWWHRRRGKPPFDAISPEAAAAELGKTPLLVIHGSRDGVVPPAHAERLAAAAPSSEAWVVTGAHHCGAYFVDREAYCARVAAFFQRSLPPAPAPGAAAASGGA